MYRVSNCRYHLKRSTFVSVSSASIQRYYTFAFKGVPDVQEWRNLVQIHVFKGVCAIIQGHCGPWNQRFSLTNLQVFDQNSTQEEVYQEAAEPLVDNMFEGMNGLLFAYGITNSGKTYTIQGGSDREGIIPRVLQDVFTRMEQNKQADRPTYHVLVSYLEIYNEKIYDLLQEGNKTRKGKFQPNKSNAF